MYTSYRCLNYAVQIIFFRGRHYKMFVGEHVVNCFLNTFGKQNAVRAVCYDRFALVLKLNIIVLINENAVQVVQSARRPF